MEGMGFRGRQVFSLLLVLAAIEFYVYILIIIMQAGLINKAGANVHKGIIEKFESLLNAYFSTDKPQTEGLPSVAWGAAELNLSSNYFGDLVKKETGKSAQEYIQSKIIEVAKERVFDTSKSISEVAYELGFKYPQHFTRLFKQHVGNTPNEYRSSLN
jgi:AraC-like DNA-binding protein